MLSVFLIACTNQYPTVAVTTRAISEQEILIEDVAVFDSLLLQIRPHMDVVIEDTKITAMQTTGQYSKVPDLHRIPGQGLTLVPGLIDMHGHLTIPVGPSWEFRLPKPEDNVLAYAYAGVTTIFDPSDTSEDAYTRRAKVQSGELVGPRIYTTGRIITHPEGHPRSLVENLAPRWIRWYLKPKIGTGVETNEQAIAAVNERIDAGADAIKIVVDRIPLAAPQIQQDIIKTVVERANARGIRTVAHIGTVEDAITAAEAGVALWVHGVYKEHIPEPQIKQLVDYGIPMVTTSEVFDRYGRSADGPIIPTKLERETVANGLLESFHPIPDSFDPGVLRSWIELMQNTSQVRLNNVRRLHLAGMIILAGSDTQSGVFPGAGLHRELANLVAAGFSEAQAIQAATLSSARFLENDENPDSGIIAVGKRADMILVEGDPTADISALANIREVFLNGALLNRVPVTGD